MKVILDRFEGDKAVLEICEGEFVVAPRVLFVDAAEGDIISIEIDKAESILRRDNIAKTMQNLWEKS